MDRWYFFAAFFKMKSNKMSEMIINLWWETRNSLSFVRIARVEYISSLSLFIYELNFKIDLWLSFKIICSMSIVSVSSVWTKITFDRRWIDERITVFNLFSRENRTIWVFPWKPLRLNLSRDKNRALVACEKKYLFYCYLCWYVQKTSFILNVGRSFSKRLLHRKFHSMYTRFEWWCGCWHNYCSWRWWTVLL